jgi:thiol:disulfide interchange protein DsbG
MRWTTGLFLLISATPALAAAPQCAMPGPTVIKTASPTAQPSASPVVAAKPQASKPTVLPASLSNIPFAQHIAAAGAQVSDLGTIHGLQAISARSGTQFMIFEISKDGQAGVSGVPIDLTVAQLQTVAAGNITDIAANHGFQGYFVRSGQQFQVFYATPDNQGLVPGVMWDATGKDLTRDQVSQIPGAVPTVEIGSTGPAGQAAPGQELAVLAKATYGTEGVPSAPKVYMLMDPQCIYSIRAFQALQPYVQAGQIQLAIIPLSVLDYEDNGQSTRSALALLSDAPDQIVGAWQSGSENNVSAPSAQARLANNMAIAQAVGLKGTPMFWWQGADGKTSHFDGVPPDASAFVAGLRS